MDIGKKIKSRRLALGMTADRLAEIIGKNRATVYRYENGEIENMPLSVVEPIAKALGMTPDEFFSRSSNDDVVSSAEMALLKKYRQLNANDKQEILNLIDFKLFQAEKSFEEGESSCI
ncbi:helix-turn-helix domain-containing protein [Phascolarctobacterium succinatutens]|uniref:helix-turn-helix domain-containing protein n=1 Tax=Phascolarctobacterium succinatutens TaxID=626940 RepID=UPI003AF54870